MKYLINLLVKLVGYNRIIGLNEDQEADILSQMSNIENINDYWQLQRQAGYQFFAKTNDRKYLGWTELAEHILRNMKEEAKNSEYDLEEKKKPIDKGYNSSIE